MSIDPKADAMEELRAAVDLRIDPVIIPLWTARALLAGEGPVPAWQPIDTVPDNHLPILVWSLETGRVVAFRDVANAWWPCPASYPLQDLPTHWMPLPASPNCVPSPAVRDGDVDEEAIASRITSYALGKIKAQRDVTPQDALEEIATQPLSTELRGVECDIDFVGGYDAVIDVARAALSYKPRKPKEGK